MNLGIDYNTTDSRNRLDCMPKILLTIIKKGKYVKIFETYKLCLFEAHIAVSKYFIGCT